MVNIVYICFITLYGSFPGCGLIEAHLGTLRLRLHMYSTCHPHERIHKPSNEHPVYFIQ